MSLTIPPQLIIGDTICLVSPSSGLAGLLPHRVEKALANLQKAGFKTKIAGHALKNSGYTSASPQDRALDIMNAFLDPEVKAIMSFIGGYASNQVLQYLDFEAIKKNPKIFIGYSDTTIPLLAIYTQTGISTYYGPAALTQFGENPNVFDYTLEYFHKALVDKNPIGEVKPSDFWTDQILDWFQKLDQKGPRDTFPNPGWKWLKTGKAEGPLVGGCLVSLGSLTGTKYWPNFQNAIFFWENPESDGDISKGTSIGKTADALEHLRELGVFEQISGMIIGRPVSYSEKDHQAIIQLIDNFFAQHAFPILYNVNFGHCDPIITIPIGRMAGLDSAKDLFQIF